MGWHHNNFPALQTSNEEPMHTQLLTLFFANRLNFGKHAWMLPEGIVVGAFCKCRHDAIIVGASTSAIACQEADALI